MIKLELNAGVLVAIINFDDTKDDKSWPGPVRPPWKRFRKKVKRKRSENRKKKRTVRLVPDAGSN